MEVLGLFVIVVTLGVTAHICIFIERAYSAMEDFDAQSEREAELLQKVRMEIEA